jgi:hypothetical protein
MPAIFYPVNLDATTSSQCSSGSSDVSSPFLSCSGSPLYLCSCRVSRLLALLLGIMLTICRTHGTRNRTSNSSLGQTFPIAFSRLRGVLDADLHALDLEQLDVWRCEVYCDGSRICNHAYLLQYLIVSLPLPCFSAHADDRSSRFAGPSIYLGMRTLVLLLYITMSVWVPHLIYFWITVVGLCIAPFLFNPHQFSYSDFIIDYREFLRWMSRGNSRTHANSWVGYCRLSRTRITGFKRKRLGLPSEKVSYCEVYRKIPLTRAALERRTEGPLEGHCDWRDFRSRLPCSLIRHLLPLREVFRRGRKGPTGTAANCYHRPWSDRVEYGVPYHAVPHLSLPGSLREYTNHGSAIVLIV